MCERGREAGGERERGREGREGGKGGRGGGRGGRKIIFTQICYETGNE